ncbi:unnamed protein product [Knipowitschia caucasica]|uniref:Sulfotransferase n=1 Tax=Knipowitschia caucasica TaxID=637954 RepID=A0AAV2LCI0_KNICA
MAFSRSPTLDLHTHGLSRRAWVVLVWLLSSLLLLHCLTERVSITPTASSSYPRLSSNNRTKDIGGTGHSEMGRFGDGGTSAREVSPRLQLRALGEGSKKLPHALIVGVKKGGTRALLEFLRVHPDVRAVGSEPHFFDRNYDKGLEWYR